MDGDPGGENHDGGGGAGAVGRIRINALGATPDIQGLQSPYDSTAATTTGDLLFYE